MSDTAPDVVRGVAGPTPHRTAPARLHAASRTLRRRLAGGEDRRSLALAVAQQALLLGTGVAAARLLGPADRGALATAVAIGGAAGGIATLGLEFTGARALRASAGDTQAPDPGTSGLLLARTGLATLAAPVLAVVLAVLLAFDPVAATLVAAPLALLVAVRALPGAALRARGDGATLAVGRLVQVGTYGALLLALALAGSAGAVSVGLAYAAAIGFATAWLATRAGGLRTGGATRPGIRSLAADLRAGAGVTAAALVSGDLAMTDVLVFGLFASPADLGVYAAARAFVNLGYFAAQAAAPSLAVRGRAPVVSVGVVAASLAAGVAGLVVAPLLLGLEFAGAGVTAGICGLAGGAYGLRLVGAEWRRTNARGTGLVPVEAVGLVVLLLPLVVGTAPAVLAASFALSQAAQAIAVAIANRGASRCAS